MTTPLRLVVSGATGRMGRTVRGLVEEDPKWELLGGLDSTRTVGVGDRLPLVAPGGEEADLLLRGADVVIDFSAPAFLRELLETGVDSLAGTALVVGTTGLTTAERELLESVSGRAPVLTSANFSLGVNVLLALVERAARALGGEFDIEIVEAHHRRKEDAPSGTALALGEAAAAGRGIDLHRARRDGRSGRPGARPPGEIGFHALRGGDVIGDHHVHFIGDRERVELVHRASDRALFAAGALHAASWLSGREPGWYTMADVLGL